MFKIKIIIFSLLVVGLGVGGYLALKSSKNLSVDDKLTQADNAKPMSSGKKKAFSEFMKDSGSYKCTVNQYIANTETKGTVYLANGLLKASYGTKVQGMNIETSVIVRDGYSYSWSSFSPKSGFKAKIDTTSGGDTSAGTSGSYSFKAEQIGDYDCQAWQADPSFFELPTGVNFTEV